MLRAGQLLQLTVIAMLGFAVIAVHSADMRVDDGPFDPLGALRSKHAVHAAVAVLVMWLASRINLRQAMRVRWWCNPVVMLWAASLGLVALAMIPGVGLEINGARRWLRLGFGSWATNFQPSELSKWAMILVLALWCASRGEHMHRFLRGVAPALAIVAVTCGLIVLQDFGTAALIAAVAAVLLIAGGARLWQFCLLLPPALIALVAAVITQPHRVKRLETFMRPWEESQGAGYQAIQSMVAFAEGGTTGRGLGNGIQKYGYLPTDTSDMLFAIICEETGLAGALFVIAMYLAIFWLGLGIVRDCKDTYGRLIGLGIIATLGIQAIINLAVVTVLVPTKGIALPLLSAGGTGWIVTAFALGLLTSLDTANHLAADEPAPVDDEVDRACAAVAV